MYIFSLLNYVIFFPFLLVLIKMEKILESPPVGCRPYLVSGATCSTISSHPQEAQLESVPILLWGSFSVSLSLSTSFSFFEKKEEDEEEEEKVMLSSILDRQGSSSFFGGDSLWPYLGEYMNYSRMIPSAIQGSAP